MVAFNNNNSENNNNGIKMSVLIIGVLGLLARAVVLFFIGAGLLFSVWNYVLAKTITFVKPMSSFWQAALLTFAIELVFAIILFKAGYMSTDEGDVNE